MSWPAAIARDFGALADRGLLWLAENSLRFGGYAAALLRNRQNRRAARERQHG